MYSFYIFVKRLNNHLQSKVKLFFSLSIGIENLFIHQIWSWDIKLYKYYSKKLYIF